MQQKLHLREHVQGMNRFIHAVSVVAEFLFSFFCVYMVNNYYLQFRVYSSKTNENKN